MSLRENTPLIVEPSIEAKPSSLPADEFIYLFVCLTLSKHINFLDLAFTLGMRPEGPLCFLVLILHFIQTIKLSHPQSSLSCLPPFVDHLALMTTSLSLSLLSEPEPGADEFLVFVQMKIFH